MARTSTSTQNPNKENSCPNAQRKLTQRRPRQALQSCDPNTHTSDDPRDSRSEAEINALESCIHELEDKNFLLSQVAQLGNLRTQDAAPAPDKSIDRPRRASKVSMRQIQQDLGPIFVMLQSPPTSIGAKIGSHNGSDKLSKAYNAIEEAFPETCRFKGQWAIDRTVKQFWDNHKTYRSCVNNKSTYRGKQVAARRAARAATSPRTSPSPPARTSPILPTPGPSRPHCRPPIDSDDDNDIGQGEDVFQPASDEDTEHNRGDEGEDEDQMSEKAKAPHRASNKWPGLEDRPLLFTIFYYKSIPSGKNNKITIDIVKRSSPIYCNQKPGFTWLVWRRRRRRMYTGAVPLRNSRGPYYIHVSFVCYGYSLPFTISQPEYPSKNLPS
ncbi:hypothetical protein B0H14DRAFT_2639630 [Mycena olivaceomarginata]|nr:hypothetical protein B0H14DRAFT_2639630 [Mycena olivaceomarginata]